MAQLPAMADAAPPQVGPSVFATPHITRLRLTNFRSHAALDVTCGGGAVVLTGANGVGKTNVLEAISMLAAGARFASVRRWRI